MAFRQYIPAPSRCGALRTRLFFNKSGVLTISPDLCEHHNIPIGFSEASIHLDEDEKKLMISWDGATEYTHKCHRSSIRSGASINIWGAIKYLGKAIPKSRMILSDFFFQDDAHLIINFSHLDNEVKG
jgi:hypothetical protein